MTNIDQFRREVKRNDVERHGATRISCRHAPRLAAALMTGVVEGIFLGGAATVLPGAVHSAAAVEGAGLAGDRYAAGAGTYSRGPKPGRQVTLIEAEALDQLSAEHGIVVSGADARRNIVTRGIDLAGLIGRTFTIGDVELVGVRDCPPCAHLEKLTCAPVLRGLAGRGGLRADVVRGGTLRVGDKIRPSP